MRAVGRAGGGLIRYFRRAIRFGFSRRRSEWRVQDGSPIRLFVTKVRLGLSTRRFNSFFSRGRSEWFLARATRFDLREGCAAVFAPSLPPASAPSI